MGRYLGLEKQETDYGHGMFGFDMMAADRDV
jgi:hypothetical protein